MEKQSGLQGCDCCAAKRQLLQQQALAWQQRR